MALAAAHLQLPHRVAPIPGAAGTAVLALDLGTSTGWALQERTGRICSGSQPFRPQRYEGGGMRFLRFQRWLTELSRAAAPSTGLAIDQVVFEEVRRHAGVDAAHAYGGFLGQLGSFCEHHHIPYQGVPVGTIKRFITGKGNASKEAVITAIRALGHSPVDDNEADALALLHWAIDLAGGADG
jgi:Holliday junction resolvasome RuvABC endonuclease subunit